MRLYYIFFQLFFLLFFSFLAENKNKKIRLKNLFYSLSFFVIITSQSSFIAILIELILIMMMISQLSNNYYYFFFLLSLSLSMWEFLFWLLFYRCRCCCLTIITAQIPRKFEIFFFIKYKILLVLFWIYN